MDHRTTAESERFRAIFRRLHAGHPACLADEWLTEGCRHPDGSPVERPIVWSRRNGPWRRTAILWVGAAPGNAGGKGSGDLGAHGTRIPFGGDIGGANFDVLLGSIGVNRNQTFVVAALNQLPARGGGEPTPAELAAPVGDYPNSIAALRDTVLAAGPRLVVALGNVALRALFAATTAAADDKPRLPSQPRLQKAGLARGAASPWPEAEPPEPAFLQAWNEAWPGAPLPHVLWLTHPSAQNVSPFAGVTTAFHTRMREMVDQLRAAARDVLGWTPPADRPFPPGDGIYALPEWREKIEPRHAHLDRLWRAKGV